MSTSPINTFNIKQAGINLLPQSGSVVVTEGDIAYRDDTKKLEISSGGSADNIVQEALAATLTNKTINGPDNVLTNIADSSLSTISTAGKVANSATTAASANTTSAIVARDGSGNFSAGTVTANLTGNASGTALNITASSNTSLTSLANLATVGTIGTGTWAGTTIIVAHGGTGATTPGASGVPTVVALTFGSTVSLDASLGNVFTLTATGDCTLNPPTNPTNGQKIIIAFLSSGGTRTLTLSASSGGFAFGSTLSSISTSASGKKDYIGCIYDSVANIWNVIGYVKGY